MIRSPYLLIGDPFLCEEKRRELIASLQKEFGQELAVVVHRAEDIPLETLLSEARTLPFLARAQLFCLRDADRFTKGELELWSTYFQSPSTHTIFLFEAESLEKNHPLFGWARKSGRVFSLQPEREKVVSNFIRRKLGESQKKITAEALELLESRVGDSFVFLDSVLDQLILHVGNRSEIDRAAVEALDDKLTRFEGFDLIQALAQRDFPKALEILNDLLELSGEDATSLVGLLHWQLRRFWDAKRWLAQGLMEREVASRLRLFGSRHTLFFKQLHRFSTGDLEKILEGLFDLDWRLKSGRAEGRYAIESWLATSIG